MLKTIERNIDPQGRIMLPKDWKRFGKRVVIIETDEELRILSRKYKKLSDIPEQVVDIKSDLADWHSVKNELLKLK